MKYRKFGNLDWQASVLGFGAMRLPVVDTYENIDGPEAVRMIRHAIDHGVNYIDTAYGYHGGNSERVVAKALKEGYREKVKVATKLPVWNVKSAEDFDRLLDEQLSKLQVQQIDLYLIHALSKDQWKRMQSFGILKWIEGAIADGRIGHQGFSFHDEFPVFKKIIDAWDGWAFCQIQYNYMNENVQAGTKGLEYAASKGIPVVVMEPLLGGNLVGPPDAIQRLWDSAVKKRTAADWALQWLWNKPEVAVVLSGMSTMQQLEENLLSAEMSGIGGLTAQELALVDDVRDTYEKLRPIPCTQCRYCMPCPSGVNIPRNLEIYNVAVMYNRMKESKQDYLNIKDDARASACTQCLECLEKCPQKIKINEWMTCIDGEMTA